MAQAAEAAAEQQAAEGGVGVGGDGGNGVGGAGGVAGSLAAYLGTLVASQEARLALANEVAIASQVQEDHLATLQHQRAGNLAHLAYLQGLNVNDLVLHDMVECQLKIAGLDAQIAQIGAGNQHLRNGIEEAGRLFETAGALVAGLYAHD